MNCDVTANKQELCFFYEKTFRSMQEKRKGITMKKKKKESMICMALPMKAGRGGSLP